MAGYDLADPWPGLSRLAGSEAADEKGLQSCPLPRTTPASHRWLNITGSFHLDRPQSETGHNPRPVTTGFMRNDLYSYGVTLLMFEQPVFAW